MCNLGGTQRHKGIYHIKAFFLRLSVFNPNVSSSYNSVKVKDLKIWTKERKVSPNFGMTCFKKKMQVILTGLLVLLLL